MILSMKYRDEWKARSAHVQLGGLCQVRQCQSQVDGFNLLANGELGRAYFLMKMWLHVIDASKQPWRLDETTVQKVEINNGQALSRNCPQLLEGGSQKGDFRMGGLR
jgi:hypothetical protein